MRTGTLSVRCDQCGEWLMFAQSQKVGRCAHCQDHPKETNMLETSLQQAYEKWLAGVAAQIPVLSGYEQVGFEAGYREGLERAAKLCDGMRDPWGRNAEIAQAIRGMCGDSTS